MKRDYIYSNAKLHYTVVSGNSDTPLILIHGQCMCGLDYEKVIEKLRENYTLYLIDCFGHGESEKAPELYRCRIIGDAIADLMELYHRRLEDHVDRMAGRRSVVRSVYYDSEASVR